MISHDKKREKELAGCFCRKGMVSNANISTEIWTHKKVVLASVMDG